MSSSTPDIRAALTDSILLELWCRAAKPPHEFLEVARELIVETIAAAQTPASASPGDEPPFTTSDAVAHIGDHGRNWDRTCPGCISEAATEVSAALSEPLAENASLTHGQWDWGPLPVYYGDKTGTFADQRGTFAEQARGAEPPDLLQWLLIIEAGYELVEGMKLAGDDEKARGRAADRFGYVVHAALRADPDEATRSPRGLKYAQGWFARGKLEALAKSPNHKTAGLALARIIRHNTELRSSLAALRPPSSSGEIR